MTNEERSDYITFVLKVIVWTKHGPMGRGERGPCSENCLKCEAETKLRELRAENAG